MSTLPKMGRPSKTGLSVKELGHTEYMRRYRALLSDDRAELCQPTQTSMRKKVKDLKDIPTDTFTESDPTPPKNKTMSLPAMTGPGVETPKIPALDKLVRKYEAAKEKRVMASPDEIAAKNELKFALHQNAASLPVNSDGFRFYRSEEYEKDFVLEETLKMKKFGTDDEDDE